jgi:hypothetical protein
MNRPPKFQPMPDFHHVVRLLRALVPEYRVMALHAAMFWSDEKFQDAEINGDLPARPGEIVKPGALQ